MEIPSFSDLWDSVIDGFDYWISGEVFSDIGEFFSGFFENLGELSFPGIVYGIILVVLVYLFRSSVFVLIDNFVFQIIFYIISFIAGYLMGKKIWD
jgi:hypothetical protein